MKYAALALVILAAPLAAQDPAPLPEFMEGAWVERVGERWTEESWSGNAVRLFGTSRSGERSEVRSRETLVIERTGDTMVLIAQPDGAAPVVFALVGQDGDSIEFANPDHDYPQRIRYWREGDTLHAEIALLDGSQANSWTYLPADGQAYRN